MDTQRLKFVNDISPLYAPGAVPPYDATRWAAEAQMSVDNIVYHENGFTTTVLRNPLITWHRSFTTDNTPPQTAHDVRPTLIHINEWLPAFQNDTAKHGYRIFGVHRLHGIAEIPADGPVTTNWRSHAKRHLKTFQKQNVVTLRRATFSEIKEPYFRSEIPHHMKAGLWRLCERHFKDHPETLEVMVAESSTDGIIAAFVSGTCREANQSFYLLGFYLPPADKPCAMVGLVHDWFLRSRAQGLKYCNFGDMCGPHFLPRQQDLGYSYFKTQFGIRRVWYPKNHWKISLPLFGKNR